MMWKKRIRREAVNQGGLAVKVVSMHMLTVVTVVAHVLAVWLSTKGSLFPGTDALMSIIGTCAEIIAGLYGLTLAGYTFFLSRIDALMASDTTLDYVVASVKNRFKFLIWYITVNVLMTLFISIVLMYCPAPVEESQAFFYRLFCNEFVLFLGFSIVLILYYSILVIDPNCLEKEAAKLKRRISSSAGLMGSAGEFISLYDRIEDRCNKMLPGNVLSQIHENKGKRFEYTIELLHEQNILVRPVINDLTRIHRYYECMVNTMPLSASQEMCNLARHVLAYLEQMASKLPETRKMMSH